MVFLHRRLRIIIVVLVALSVPTAAWLMFRQGSSPALGSDEYAVAAGRGLSGQVLVATGRMTDLRFAGSVIYMLADDEGGAMGLIVNRVIGRGPLSALLAGFGIFGAPDTKTLPLHYGGPVMPKRGFILHSGDYVGPGSRMIAPGVSLSTGPAVLQAMASGDGPKQSRVMLGYAGWAPGQLDEEIARGDWLTASAGPAVVFDADAETLWTRIYPRAGHPL